MKKHILHITSLVLLLCLCMTSNAKDSLEIIHAFDAYYSDAVSGKRTLQNSHTNLPTLEQILENMPYDTAIELAVLQDISGRINELSAEDFSKLQQLQQYHEEHTFAKLYPGEIIRSIDQNLDFAQIISEIISKREHHE